jgi:hypothetical protein
MLKEKFLVVILFVLYCCSSIIEKDNSYYWLIIPQSNGIVLHSLFKDSTEIQTLFMKDNQPDSFLILGPMRDRMFGGKIDSIQVKQYINYFVNEKDFVNDSIHLFFFKPVEEGYSYKYNVLKDNKLVWEKELKAEPVFNFSYPFSSKGDTANHIFTIKHWVYKDNKIYGPYTKELWHEKSGKLKYDYELW